MNRSDTFRIVFVALLIGMRLARIGARKQTSWRANWPAMKRHPWDTALLLLVSACWASAVVLFLLVPGRIAAFDIPLPPWARWSAAIAALGGILLLRRADRALGENLSVTLQIKPRHTLVTDGPYRWIRHPIYAAGLLFSAAMGVMTANGLLAVLFFLPMAVLAAARIGREERMMLEHFGAAYRRYMQQTGRLLPAPGRNVSRSDGSR